MTALARHRHTLAPATGAAALLAAMFGLETGPVPAILVGALVWGALALVLTPRDRFAALLRRAGADRARRAEELAEITARQARLRDYARHPLLQDSLSRINGGVDLLLADLRRNPDDYARLRKPLVHHLGHAVSIADRFVYMDRVSPVPEATRERVVRALAELADLFDGYRTRMVADEALDLDARLRLLEAEITADGGGPHAPKETS